MVLSDKSAIELEKVAEVGPVHEIHHRAWFVAPAFCIVFSMAISAGLPECSF